MKLEGTQEGPDRRSGVLERPNRRAVTDWAVEQLYDLIFTGALPSGADLGEEDLSARLGVSRTTVSAALRQLEGDGLVAVAAMNGRRVVASFDVQDIHELYTIRGSLEALAIAFAIDHVDDALTERLNALQSEMESRFLLHANPDRRDFEVDFDFHRVIVEASGIGRLSRCLAPMWNQTHVLLRHLHSVGVYPDEGEDVAAFSDHREIIAALTARDRDRGVAAIRAHLNGRRDHLIAGVLARGHVA